MFLQLLLRMCIFLRKVGLYIGFILLLSSLDGLDDVSGILIHADWRVWWTIALWVVTLPFLVACMTVFRSILFKEVKLYYSIAFYPATVVVLIGIFRFMKRKLHEPELPRLRVYPINFFS
ncbi:hypothetical protein [Paenibacillus albus]|uniref:Uncharacterized protein n=1 Tax=Paenibacillus albus TaxID=2495582 RepID=A0A3Q8X5V1_9BACL|nr:hypothetical protein [Paenibacillus albus]AZN39580.1 hypothetical protein EJC50_07820 [Paenibacillus albus]